MGRRKARLTTGLGGGGCLADGAERCVASGCDVASSSSAVGTRMLDRVERQVGSCEHVGLITQRPRRFVTRVDATMLLSYALAGAAHAVVQRQHRERGHEWRRSGQCGCVDRMTRTRMQVGYTWDVGERPGP